MTTAGSMADDLEEQLRVSGSPIDEPESVSSAPSGRIDRARRQASKALDKLAKRRGDSKLVDAGFLVWARHQRFPSSLLAGALVTRIAIYVITFLLLLIFAMGLFADVAGSSPENAAREAGMAGLFAQATSDSTAASGEARVITIVVTLVAVLWAADGVARNLRRVFAVVWQVPVRRRRFRWALSLAVVGFSLVALALSRTSLGLAERPVLSQLAQSAVEVLAVAGLWLLVTRALPHDPAATSWKDFLPGAMVVAFVVLAAKLATVHYFAPLSVSYSEKYGSIGIVLIILSWGYLLSYALVASADVNAAVFRARRQAGSQTL